MQLRKTAEMAPRHALSPIDVEISNCVLPPVERGFVTDMEFFVLRDTLIGLVDVDCSCKGPQTVDKGATQKRQISIMIQF